MDAFHESFQEWILDLVWRILRRCGRSGDEATGPLDHWLREQKVGWWTGRAHLVSLLLLESLDVSLATRLALGRKA